MSLSLDIEFKDDATGRLQKMVTATQDPTSIMTVAARAIANFLKSYHRDFIPKWKGARYMEGERSGQFGQEVVDGWQAPSVSGNQATVSNIFPLLSHKVTGGTIHAKRGRMLTIPLIPEAKGLTAAAYSLETGLSLFIPRGKNVLATRKGSEGYFLGKRGGIKKKQMVGGKNPSVRKMPIVAVYALVPSVEQEPWPGAMPSDIELHDRFSEAIGQAMDAIVQDGEVQE